MNITSVLENVRQCQQHAETFYRIFSQILTEIFVVFDIEMYLVILIFLANNLVIGQHMKESHGGRYGEDRKLFSRF